MRLHPCFVPWLSVTLHFVWLWSLWSFNSTTTNHSKKSHFCVTSPQSVTGKPIPEPICKHLIHVLLFALFRCAIFSSVLCMSMISLQRVLSMRSLDRDYSFFTPKKTLAFVLTLWTILVSYLLLPAFNVWDKIGHKPGHPFCTVWKNNEDVFFYPDTLVYLFGYFFPLIVLIVSYAMMYKQLKDCTFRAGKEGQVTKSALIMVGGFVFIYTPGILNYLFNDLTIDHGIPQLSSAALIFAWSHAFINPICYIFFNTFYRTEYLITFKIVKEEDLPKSGRLSRAPSSKIYSINMRSRSPSPSPRMSKQVVSVDPSPRPTLAKQVSVDPQPLVQ